METSQIKMTTESFWIKTDFLNLNEYVSLKIVKTYYIIFYITLALFLITFILLLFPFDASYEYKTTYLLNKIDNWNKDLTLRTKIENFDTIFFECNTKEQACLFNKVLLEFQGDKFDYFWDDYKNKYFESFWVNKEFSL